MVDRSIILLVIILLIKYDYIVCLSSHKVNQIRLLNKTNQLKKFHLISLESSNDDINNELTINTNSDINDVKIISSESSNKESNVLVKLLSSYTNLLNKHPYVVKIISSGIIGGLGDILIQQFQRRLTNKPFDYRRLIVFTNVAAWYIAPVINIWFNWLNYMPMPKGISQVGKALIMMLADQTIGATVITIGFFYAFELFQRIIPPYGLFAGSFLSAGLQSTKNNLWITLIANWYCWPVINFVNFLWIPLQYRVLFSNTAAVFWNMFLSSVANRKV